MCYAEGKEGAALLTKGPPTVMTVSEESYTAPIAALSSPAFSLTMSPSTLRLLALYPNQNPPSSQKTAESAHSRRNCPKSQCSKKISHQRGTGNAVH